MKRVILFLFISFLSFNSFSQTSKKKKEPAIPSFIKKDIEEYKKQDAKQWPIITRYEYKGKYVYYFRMPCCDQINSVFDAKGKCLGTPDGGVMGKPVSDPLPDFNKEKKDPKQIWPEPSQN